MKRLVTVFLIITAIAIGLTVTRDLTSRERRSLDAVVTAFVPQFANESRTVPLPGDVEVMLRDGRSLRLSLLTSDEVKAGSHVRVSEMVAPWGAVWYRLAAEN